ncbi:serine protease [Fulvivirgaceae bacterium BMA10]|uniref:Serine protease n=1 Tax=Splendidivirga corallicola TaxID=3051826 RepID=A0ABT8KNT2_9BACT|nr:serine protease [Fulvivirgaceae bacterium BMA10]
MKVSCFSLIVMLTLMFLGYASHSQSIGALKGGVVKLSVVKKNGVGETGSGILIGVQGGKMYILAALHTVEDHSSIQVNLYEQSFSGSAYVNENIDRRNDLAVVIVNYQTAINNILIFDEGETQSLIPSNQVFTIGHPNNFPWTDSRTQIKRKMGNFIVANKTPLIDRGNSGGPVINQSGELVGMVTEVSNTEVKALKIDYIINKLREWSIPYKLRIPVNFCPVLQEIVTGAWDKFEGWGNGNVMPSKDGGSQLKPKKDISGIGQSWLMWGDRKGHVRYYVEFPSSTDEATAYRDYQNLIKDIDRCLTNAPRRNISTHESDRFSTHWSVEIRSKISFVKGHVWIWLRKGIGNFTLEIYRESP